jgi:hypothetical protein
MGKRFSGGLAIWRVRAVRQALFELKIPMRPCISDEFALPLPLYMSDCLRVSLTLLLAHWQISSLPPSRSPNPSTSRVFIWMGSTFNITEAMKKMHNLISFWYLTTTCFCFNILLFSHPMICRLTATTTILTLDRSFGVSEVTTRCVSTLYITIRARYS